MQGLADSAGAGVQLSHHALDLLAQACRIQVNAKDVLAAVESLQAAEVLGTFLDFQGSIPFIAARNWISYACIASLTAYLGNITRPKCNLSRHCYRIYHYRKGNV